MKAAIINNFGKPDVLEIKEVEIPGIKENEILIKAKASSVNPVDWKHRHGNHKLIMGSPFPIILGYDVAGIVDKVGANVKQFKPGDKVFARVDRKYGGAYAEYVATSEQTVAKISNSLSFEVAAAIPLAALTALQGLRDKGHIKAKSEVLINGAASGVGHFALQIANYYNATVTAVCSSKHKQMLNDLKPAYFVDYKQYNIKSISRKFDIIFDIVGTESFMSLRHLLKPGGIYITTLPRPKVLLHKFISLFTNGKKVETFIMKPLGADLEVINNLLEQNKLKVYIDKIFPLEEIAKAHEYSETGQAEGKIVIRIN
ncbi:MAG: NAD(P)-dependent alcohol dehydrogenase [Chlorobi bacterium]|nr:NAD(P)-dependent alcohol dehydrogenase [Chlorobiota bacterium]